MIKKTYIQINSKKFIIFKQTNLILVTTKESKSEPTYLIKNPIKIKFQLKIKKVEKTIYSQTQFNKILEYYEIDFPIYDNRLLLKNKFAYYYYSIHEIINFDFEEVFKEKADIEAKIKNKQSLSFRDLSKYINLYVKSNIDLNNYVEKDYIKFNEFDPNSLFNYYEHNNREKFASLFEFFEGTLKERFLTGPHGIGKTFSLLYLLISNKIENNIIYSEEIENEIKYLRNKYQIYKAYFNLKTLTKQENYIEIIIYETRYLFNDKKDYQNFYKELYNKLINKNYLLFIFTIFGKFVELYPDKKVIIILDEFKYKDENDIDELNEIRDLVENSSNLYLIVCSSLNYKGVKTSLIFHLNKNNYDKRIPNYILYNELTDNKLLFPYNKYLEKLNYFPQYCEIKNILSQKVLNLLKKQIKEKIKKFYENKENEMIKNLEKLVVDKILDKNQFEDILKTFPIKYLKIDLKNRKFHYLFPLAKIAIDELIYSHELKERISDNKLKERWIFENTLFNYISETNKFLDFYIDKSYRVDTIFNEEILPSDFSLEENTLFSFKFSNVKRYNGAIYFGDKKILVLIQASINKTEKSIKKYNSQNMLNDLLEIQPFLRQNNIIPQHYYLLFIFDYDNYSNNESYHKALKNYNFQYIYFDSTNLKIINKGFYKFNYEINFNNNLKGKTFLKIGKAERFIFTKNFYFEKLNNCYNGPIFYAYKGMTFNDFIDEIFDDLREKDDKFSENRFKETSTLRGFCSIKDLERFHQDEFKNKFIFVYLEMNNLFFARGEFFNKRIKLNQKLVEYQYIPFLKYESEYIKIKGEILGFSFFYD